MLYIGMSECETESSRDSTL